MNIKHEPWNETQAPQQFKRTDPSGRWSPIVNDDDEPLIPDEIFLRILWCVSGVIGVILLYLSLHVEKVIG